ncbi:C6 transcription factor [Pyrenophora seminiperda CCB06]|uniref:C6 transcription factor n=1 Tax=Pyrenophora seminiperda CCB06 TaxID=1302712 RepID=A0A3M7M3N2_9PLEO|nr:C6 transcription factor [Pyrenophora seminiperda CCB06]
MTSSATLPIDASSRRQLPTRVSKACERCHRLKSRVSPALPVPCSLCVRANVECIIGNDHVSARALKRKRTQGPSREASQEQRQTPNLPTQTHDDPHQVAHTEVSSRHESRRPSIAEGEADSAMGIAQRIYRLGSQPVLTRTTSAIPGSHVYGTHVPSRLDGTQRLRIESILGYPLPPVDMMRALLEEYFDSVHWFSLVIYEPRFRSKFDSVKDGLAYPSQKSFLLLLSTVTGMGAWYKSQRNDIDLEFPDEDWHAWSQSLVQSAGSQLHELMDQSTISSVQACILLGSYYVYHGKPNLSFALLGATIRTAQAIGLHRQPPRGVLHSIEERKRVWWTIYTWDRFASVTYGRPVGINEKDCNVAHPIDIFESPCFKVKATLSADASICYSAYQRELNKLYLIASPIIEIIFGMRTVKPNERPTGSQYSAQVMDVTGKLWTWHRRLPAHLLLDMNSDCGMDQSRTSRVHQLQALSLQLTFDSLLIIFNRPLIAKQVDHLIRNQPESGHGVAPSPTSLTNVELSPFSTANENSPLNRSHMSSTEQWWDAALRTSKVTELPRLSQLATDSHLVAFLAINLFNAAIVMARTITRIFRLQELLGKKTQLSMQSNVVLKDVIQMLLRREADAMFGESDLSTTPSGTTLMSVEDTLRLPTQMPLGEQHKLQQNTADSMQRVHESMTSVQRVFPMGLDGVYRDDLAGTRANDSHSSHVPSGNDDWSNAEIQDFNIEGELDWISDDNGIDATGNGLYWVWDSVWSDPQL